MPLITLATATAVLRQGNSLLQIAPLQITLATATAVLRLILESLLLSPLRLH